MLRLIELIRAEMKNTIASGAKITTHLKALANMKLPKGVKPVIVPSAPVTTDMA